MKILMLTPYVPYPPASGGQIRTLNLLKYLSKNNEITLIALYKNNEEKTYLSFLKPYCKQIYLCKRPEKPWQLKTIFGSIFSLKPFLVVRNFSQSAKEKVKEVLQNEKFDVIHAETFYIMPHILDTQVPIFLVEQTIEYKVYQHYVNSLPFFIRIFFYLDILKLKYWERFYWRKAKLVGTVSESDKCAIQHLESHIHPVIIPNGAGDEMIAKRLNEKNLKQPLLLFMGNFSWLQNTEAVKYLIKNIFPLIKQKLPGVKLLIAGQRAFEKLQIKPTEDINIVEIPPKNTLVVRDLYRKATLFIGPIFGPGGTRLKILAAMASGIPVISTKTGVEGLDIQHKTHVLIASSPREFTRQIQYILSRNDIYHTIRKNAFLLVKEIYNWKSIASQLEIVYKQIINYK